MSDTLTFLENELQLAALAFMGAVYFLRILWILRWKASRERQPKTGPGDVTPLKGILHSWTNIATPWSMESTRMQPGFYLQFVFFHLGVAASIALSFVIPYGPQILEAPGVVSLFQILMGTAGLIGVYRIFRRIRDPYIRAISSPDDFFSLVLLTVWLFVSVMAAPNRPHEGEGILMLYFVLTAFFLVYVPFSKISHYLYYPFTRYYFGKSMGHRGVYPVKRADAAKPSRG